MYHLTSTLVFIAVFAIGTRAEFTSPSAEGGVEDWRIGSNRTVAWTTANKGITRLAVFDSTGNGFQLADNEPVTSPFLLSVEDNLDVDRNPWHFALFDENNNPIFNSVNFDVVADDDDASTTAQSTTAQSTRSSTISSRPTTRSTTISTSRLTTIIFSTTTTSPTPISSSTSPVSPLTTPTSLLASSTQTSAATGSTASTTLTGGASSSGLSHSAVVGIGAGLGIGIPLLLIAGGIGAFVMGRRSRRARESSAFGIEYVDEAAKRQGR